MSIFIAQSNYQSNLPEDVVSMKVIAWSMMLHV